MSEEWRIWLYPLGFLPQLLFSGRFLLQWLISERRGRSCVPRAFWHLSLVGHCLMVLHACMQLQYHIGVIQGSNAVIAWRNLDLTGRRRYGIMSAVFLFAAVTALVTALFAWQEPEGWLAWLRAPRFSNHSSPVDLGWGWHLWGFFGILLFSSRFWVQWWQAERSRQSTLGPIFWWLTCSGNVIMLLYFWRLGDPINWLGPLLSMLPSVRNLILLRREAERHAC